MGEKKYVAFFPPATWSAERWELAVRFAFAEAFGQTPFVMHEPEVRNVIDDASEEYLLAHPDKRDAQYILLVAEYLLAHPDKRDAQYILLVAEEVE